MFDLSHVSKLPDEALVSVRVLAGLTGQGVSTVWRKFGNEPGYPKPIKVGTRCTRVNLGDIRAFVAAKAAQ